MSVAPAVLNEELASLGRRLGAPAGGEDGAPSRTAGLKGQIKPLLRALRAAMYPQIFTDGTAAGPAFAALVLREGYERLEQALCCVLEDPAAAGPTALALLRRLPEIRALLDTDVQAAYDGDPAARSAEEIMLSYPAFEAVSIYRIAHELYALGVPLLPRMMTEYAHRLTGIDIHPGAAIGAYFFMDHGTGIVIGETTMIGDHVKLYQGVTLGAKSIELVPDGNPVKGIKRHPDIGSRVVIYAGATILGGKTVIGDGCVIGGSVWLTHSVRPGTTVVAAGSRANAAAVCSS